MEASEADEPGSANSHGSGIIAAVKASGIEYILALPDITTSSGLLSPIAKDARFG